MTLARIVIDFAGDPEHPLAAAYASLRAALLVELAEAYPELPVESVVEMRPTGITVLLDEKKLRA